MYVSGTSDQHSQQRGRTARQNSRDRARLKRPNGIYRNARLRFAHSLCVFPPAFKPGHNTSYSYSVGTTIEIHAHTHTRKGDLPHAPHCTIGYERTNTRSIVCELFTNKVHLCVSHSTFGNCELSVLTFLLNYYNYNNIWIGRGRLLILVLHKDTPPSCRARIHAHTCTSTVFDSLPGSVLFSTVAFTQTLA